MSRKVVKKGARGQNEKMELRRVAFVRGPLMMTKRSVKSEERLNREGKWH